MHLWKFPSGPNVVAIITPEKKKKTLHLTGKDFLNYSGSSEIKTNNWQGLHEAKAKNTINQVKRQPTKLGEGFLPAIYLTED